MTFCKNKRKIPSSSGPLSAFVRPVAVNTSLALADKSSKWNRAKLAKLSMECERRQKRRARRFKKCGRMSQQSIRRVRQSDSPTSRKRECWIVESVVANDIPKRSRTACFTQRVYFIITQQRSASSSLIAICVGVWGWNISDNRVITIRARFFPRDFFS